MGDKNFVNFECYDSGVSLLTLNNPPLNLNTLTTINKLNTLFDKIKKDPNIRVLVITGKGSQAFCAGSDINEFSLVRNNVVQQKLAKENQAFSAIEETPIPVIAALNGVTLGGGAEIALACDIRIIDETAKIGFPEVNLGVFPGSGGIFRLPRLVGPGRAYELLYTGDIIDSQEAYRIGLVNRVAPEGKALSVAMELAQTLANKPALALSLIRSGVRDSEFQTTAEATERTLNDSHLVFSGPDVEEGITAFFEKRPPTFNEPRFTKKEKFK